MSLGPWSEHCQEISRLLAGISCRDERGRELAPDAGVERWLELTNRLRAARRTIYLVGNGASASLASHFAADLAKNGRLHTEVFSDLSLITAIANDLGYAQIFAEPLARRARPGDLLIAISSSGRSPNVLAAVRAARAAEVAVVTLSAMQPDNPLRALGDLNWYVAGRTYGAAETCHAALLHHYMDCVEATGAEGECSVASGQ